MEPTTPDHHDVDVVLEEIRPRMAAEKQRYLRRRFGVIVTLPLLAVGAIAYAASDDEAPVNQVADAPVEEPAIEEKAEKDTPVVEKSDATENGEKDTAEKVETPKEPGSYVDTKTMDEVTSLKADTETAGDALDKELADVVKNAGDAITKAGDDAKAEADAKAKAEAEAKADAEKAQKAPAPPSDVVETASATVGDAGTVSMTRNGASVSVTVTGTNAGWTAQVDLSGGAKALVTFSADDGTKWIAMGTIEGDELTVKTWSEYWPTEKVDKADDGKKKNGNKKNGGNKGGK